MLGGSFLFALDGSNRPHITYTENYNNPTNLRYTKWMGRMDFSEIVVPGIVSLKTFQLDGVEAAYILIRRFKSLLQKRASW